MMMSVQAVSTLVNHAHAQSGEKETISSRFGEIVVDVRNAMHFPKGLLGMPGCQHFALVNFPSQKMQQFKLLQCLDDFSISFITLPLPLENSVLKRADIEAIAHDSGIAPDQLVTLLMVCVHRAPDGTRLSVNARAPIFIDSARKRGGQHVFTHDSYPLQHYIT